MSYKKKLGSTMKKRLFVFITGQYRKFWHSWNNLVVNLFKPNDPYFEIHVCVGIDKTWRSTGYLWAEGDREVFEKHLHKEWASIGGKNIILQWVDCNNPYLQDAVSSLEDYREKNILTPYWFDYLVHRSGSCIEYAQIAQLYEIISSKYEINDDDLMMRTRTDILLRHPICFDSIPPDVSSPTQKIFQNLFKGSQHFDQFEEPTGREVSIFPSTPTQQNWIITMRKNLIYIMPLKAGKLLLELVRHYGDWDTPEHNTYWFNAESQFRGCFRNNGFTLWEHSQNKDECFGDFENLPDEFPLYAIYR